MPHVVVGAGSSRTARGMVTAELAFGLLTVAMVSVIAMFTVTLVVVQTRCGDTAAAIARQAARGDAAGVASAKATAPRGARIQVVSLPDAVRVTVSVDESLGAFGPFHLSGSAQSVAEPGVNP